MSRPLHGRSLFGSLLVLGILGCAIAPLAGGAGITIPEGDLYPLMSPCQLSIADSPTTRVLTWAPVSGAASYRVGFIHGSEVVGLTETSNTTYTHTGFDPGACLKYVVVAYDGSAHRVCAAAAQVGKCP